MNRGQRLARNANARSNARNSNRRQKPKRSQKGNRRLNPRGRERSAPDHYLHRRSANFSLRRRRIDRPLFGINGVQGHPTPVGVFSVISKELWHRSNIYSAAPMPYMQRITWSGIAVHAGVLPGHPASHGCIRSQTTLRFYFWHLTRRGTRVIIARHDVHPVQIAEPAPLSKSKTASSSQVFDRRLCGERRPHARDKSCPVSAKC